MADSVFITNTELSVSETAGTVFESISRSGSLAGAVTVSYGITGDTATLGLDFVGGNGTVTIPAGVSRVTVPIQIVNDNLAEPTENFAFSLTSSPDATIATPRTSRIAILDDETPAPPPNPEPPLTSNYNVTPVALATGVNQPVRFVFSPLNPSQVYVAGKSGVIALSDLTTGITRTVIDLSAQVNDAQDRGLLDIALDPNFAQNGFIYAFMVVDPAGTAGQTGGAAPDGNGNRYSQVVRYTANPATGFTTIVPNSAKILLGAAGQSLADISGGGALDFTDQSLSGAISSDQFINPNAATPPVVINGFKQDYLKDDSRSHAGGHLTFGPDGKLYVSVGDGTSFDYADPRSVNVQSLDSLSGKILRIDPATGLGLADNPFVTSGVSLDSDRAKVYQLGLRNPFSVTFAPDGRLFIADTGWFSWEEIDSGGPGANFGWPFFEGNDSSVSARAPDYQDMPAAQAFYSSVANGTTFVTAPIRAFSHNSADPGFQNQAITAGEAIYTGNIYPASLQNNFFFTNFPNGQIFAVNINNSADAKFLYSVDGTAPTDFVQGPDGSIYYSDPVTGVIGRLDITDASAPVGTPVTLAVGSGPDALVLKISQDAFQGSAQYLIAVDGAQIGGTLTAGASHAAAQDDTITVLGNFAPGPHTLTVNFVNDAYGGTSTTDRNLYVDGITYNTVAVPAGTAIMFSGGPVDFGFTDTGTVTPPPPPPPPGGTTIGSGPDTLVLKISQDAFQGSAQYTVSVDGAQIGATLTAGASHAAAQDDTINVLGNFAPGPHTLTVNFVNDAYGGTSATDRNLYVDGITYNTVAVPAGTAIMFSGGPVNFGFTDTGTVTPPPPPPPPPPGGTTIGSGPDTLALKISQDAFQGSAQYTVSVDGVAIGTAPLTATALHGSGQDDAVTVLGNFAPGPHVLTVNFLNDLWNGTPTTDRNLYIDGATYNGAAVPGSVVSLFSGGPQQIAFTDVGAGTTPPPPPPPPPPGGTTLGSGPDALVLKISQDAFQGSAQYTINVDGAAIGTTLTAAALHGSGQDDTITVLGNFGTTAHTLTVNYLNDAYGGSPTTDRNLYVDGVTFKGATVPGATAAMFGAGSQSFSFGGGGAALLSLAAPNSLATPTTVTIDPTDTSPVVNLSNVNIVATAGDHTLFIGGSFDTATLTGGAETVLASQGNNSITTGAAADTIRIGGSGNVVDAGGGTNHIEDNGSGNTIVMPGPGGFDDVFGAVLQNGDTLDFQAALAATAWDGSNTTLGNFLRVTMAGNDATVAMARTAGGAFTDVAALHGSGTLDLPGLLAHAVV